MYIFFKFYIFKNIYNNEKKLIININSKDNLGIDSPVFDGVYNYATYIAGASIGKNFNKILFYNKIILLFVLFFQL